MNYKKKDELFWKTRSEHYNELDWVNDSSYINEIISSGDFNKNDLVLDVGTGTGVIAHSLSPLVKKVIGIDISQDMLNHSKWKNSNKYFLNQDIRDPFFNEGLYDKITARMVFHHVIDKTQDAMDECYRIGKKGGKMILIEGVPIVPEVKEEYAEMFKLKEERLTFLEEDLTTLMKNSGYKNIKVQPYVMENFSVKNWLEKSGLGMEKINKIFDLHINGSDEFKKAHNMKIVEGDCLIDTKNLIVIGEK